MIAVPVDLTWDWKLNDLDVTTFRFQLDGEDENKWIVVDSSVTSYSAKDLDGTKEYTLYLQQSDDGVFFSKSVKSTNSAIISPESLVAPLENASDVR